MGEIPVIYIRLGDNRMFSYNKIDAIKIKHDFDCNQFPAGFIHINPDSPAYDLYSHLYNKIKMGITVCHRSLDPFSIVS